MISIKKAFFVLVILLAFQIVGLSQSLIVDLRLGAAGFRGETSKGAALLEELGQDFSLKAYRPFKKSKWQLSGEFSYSHTMIELDLASKNNTNLANYKATAIHYYLGAGARYMLNEDIEVIEDIKFNKAQFLPYLDISVGLLNF